MKIIFVRHGHPNYEKDCLTPLGHLQAAAAAERLKDCGIQEIYASSCGRAVETAGYTAEALGLGVEKLDFMREIAWSAPGSCELYGGGHPWDTVDSMVSMGESLLRTDWTESGRFVGNKVIEYVENVARGLDEWLAGLGYKREGAYYRIGKNTDKTIALFSHGGSCSAVLSHMFNLPFPFICHSIHLDYTSVTVLTLSDEEGTLTSPRLELANDAKHIRGIEGENIYGN